MGSLGGSWAGFFRDFGLREDRNAGRAYMVGERGPELFQPSTSGMVIPNHALGSNRGGGGGVTLHLTQNFENGLDEVRLSEVVEQSKQSTMEAVLEAVRRGGFFRQGLQA